MARPRKPTSQLELVGAFKKDPQRRRDSEPQCDEDVIMLDVLSENGQRAWEILESTAVPGVLTAMDSGYLALVAESLGEVWWGDAKTITDRARVGTMLGKLGMTPSDRSNVIVPKKRNDTGRSFKDLARKA